MALANPQALWFLLLLIPLILGWKQRPRAKRTIGNAFMWRPAASTSLTKLAPRLRRHWLLIAQIAFVLAAVGAIARPMLPFGVYRVAIIVDLSASMGAREARGTRLDAAATAARSTIQSLPRGTHVWLIAARSTAEAIGEYLAWDPLLARAIDALQPTAGRADLSAAIDAARHTSGAAPDAIYVFSDAPKEDSVHWVGVGTPAANAAITIVAARRLPLAPTDGQVLVEAWNYGPAAVDTEIEVAQNASVVRRYPVRLPPRQPAVAVVDVSGIEGIISARLLVRDALDVDNLRYAVVPSIRPIRVLLAGGTFFLEKALAANRSLTIDTADGGGPYDVTVCEGCAAPPPGDAPVLIIPPSAERGADPRVIAVRAPRHPIARMLNVTGIRAISLDPMTPDTSVVESTVIARIGERPAIVASEGNGRRIVELRFDVTDPGVGLSTAFPILIANAVEWLASRGENARALVAGEPLHWILRKKHTRPVEVIGPAGRPIPASPTATRVTSSETYAAGVYVVGDEPDSRFVVNPATEGESDLTGTGGGAAGARSSTPSAPRLNQQVITPLLLFALALLHGEWWLRYRAARRG